jgi:hypothetical protein
MRQSKLQLPMYKSRFRENGLLASAVDICSRFASESLPSTQRLLSTHSARSPFQNMELETFLCRELFSIACELQGLTYILDLHSQQPGKIGPLQREFFEDTFAAVQHSLVLFPHPTVIGVMTSTMSYRQHCWRLAAMIYLNTAVRCWGRASEMVKELVYQLISSLRGADLSSMWFDIPEISLWIVFLGSYAAWDEVNLGWLLSEFRHGVRILDLQSIDKLEDLLKSFPYRQSMFRGELCMIWQRINT